MHAVAWTPYGAIDFWTVSPNLFLVKTGAVLIGLAAVIWVTRARTRLPGVLTALSRESLLVYVAHLALLYRPIFGIAVFRAVGPRLGPWPVAASAVLLMGAMSALAWGWYQEQAICGRGARLAARWRDRGRAARPRLILGATQVPQCSKYCLYPMGCHASVP